MVLFILLWTGPAAAEQRVPEVSVTQFRDNALSRVTSVTTGPDGNVWFTQASLLGGGRITPKGVVTTFPGIQGFDITAGSDGNLWFAGYDMIGRVTPAGTVTKFTDGISGQVTSITAGPDGNIWFTEQPKYSSETTTIGRVTPSGVVTSFADGPGRELYSITAGPDGNVWFGDTGEVARITPQGTITRFSKGIQNATGISAGPDGNLWISDTGYSPVAIVRMTPRGTVTRFKKGITRTLGPITKGPDGHSGSLTSNMGTYSPDPESLGELPLKV